MYSIEQLENKIKYAYPSKISEETQERRLTNINAIQEMIHSAIKDNDLIFSANEERLHIFTTQAGEKIFIQYPGKESILTGDKKRPYDFRPRVMTSSGVMLRDFVFADIWGAIENLNTDHHRMLKIMAAIFFRLGRMTFHNKVTKNYTSVLLNDKDEVISTTVRSLDWFEFGIENDIIESLNFHAEKIQIDDDISISLEAFICFFELLLQNEDSKYYYKKHDLSSGRIPTSDSMLLLSATLFGQIRLSILLQRFVSGFGVARCNVNEIEPATAGLIHIVDRKKELIEYYNDNNILYTSSSYITINKTKYRALLKTLKPKIAIISTASEATTNALTGAGWTVFDINSLTNESTFNFLIELYKDETSKIL